MASKKTRLSPAGRRSISAAAKNRWAEYRLARRRATEESGDRARKLHRYARKLLGRRAS